MKPLFTRLQRVINKLSQLINNKEGPCYLPKFFLPVFCFCSLVPRPLPDFISQIKYRSGLGTRLLLLLLSGQNVTTLLSLHLCPDDNDWGRQLNQLITENHSIFYEKSFKYLKHQFVFDSELWNKTVIIHRHSNDAFYWTYSHSSAALYGIWFVVDSCR